MSLAPETEDPSQTEEIPINETDLYRPRNKQYGSLNPIL